MLFDLLLTSRGEMDASLMRSLDRENEVLGALAIFLEGTLRSLCYGGDCCITHLCEKS